MFERVHSLDRAALLPLRRSVRRFLDEERAAGGFVPAVNCWMAYDRAFSERCAAAGFVGMTLPKAYGGQERSFAERHVVAEELLAAGAPVAAHWIADRQSGPQILRHGSERLRRELLPLIAAGRCTFAIGMSEPDVGSDLASVRTRAERADGGWLVHGTKLWTSNADKADWLIALVRTAPAGDSRHAGLSQLLVDLRRPGVAVRPVRTIGGEGEFCEVHFDGYRAADDEVLGTAGEGWSLVIEELASERSGPDRFLTTFPLLAAALDEGAFPATADEELGRTVARLGALQAMSGSVASAVTQRLRADLDAVIVKDLGTGFEQELPEFVRRASRLRPRRGDGRRRGEDLARAMLAAPSFSLRGGTREILRGIIARGAGLR